MSFLIWDNQSDCADSLDAVNNAYGCPYVLPNDYRMDQWDILMVSVSGDCGFFAPESRPSYPYVEGLLAVLIPGFSEVDGIPDGFFIEDAMT